MNAEIQTNALQAMGILGQKEFIGKLRKEVWAGLSPTDALKRIANVGERTTVENHMKKTIPDAFVQFDAGTGTWIKPRTGGTAQEAALAARLSHSQENLAMWQELNLRGSEGLTPAQNALLAASLTDATKEVFGNDLFTGVPPNKIAQGLTAIVNSQVYRDAVKDKLTSVFMKAATFDGTALKNAYDTAVTEEAAAQTAYTAAPLADKPARRNEWEQKMRALDQAKQAMEDPAKALEIEIKDVGKDALLEILSTQIETGATKYTEAETQEKTEHTTTATGARGAILETVWKKRSLNKKTLIQEEVINKGEARKLKETMMRGGSEAVLQQVLKSKKVDAKTREAFMKLKTENPQEYEKLKAQVAKDFMHDYLEGGGTLTMREVKKIIKKGHEADLYRIVAMAMKGKDDPASVAMNDLDLDTLKAHLEKTPFDKIKPHIHNLFTTRKGRLILLAALGSGAGLWYWANFHAVNAAVGGAASWVGSKIGDTYGAIKDAIVGYENVPGAIENATNWWQQSVQPGINTAMEKTGEFAFGTDPDAGGVLHHGALYSAAYGVRSIPTVTQAVVMNAGNPDANAVIGPVGSAINEAISNAKLAIDRIKAGAEAASHLEPIIVGPAK